MSQQEEKDKVEDPSFMKIMKVNGDEWPYIMAGCIGACITGLAQPGFAVLFAKIINVRLLFISLMIMSYYVCYI